MRSFKHALAALAVLGLSLPALAHDTWLLPERFALASGDRLVLALTSGMAFPAPETAVRPERLAAQRVRLDGKTHTLKPGAADRALQLATVLKDAGLATAWIETHPRSLTLTAEQVAHYLEEVGAADTIGEQWKRSGQGAWRETYVKLAKTIVRVGSAGDSTWKEPLGLALEIVPESDPTRLNTGGAFSIRLLWQGQPQPGLAVGAAAAAPAKPTLVRTDGQGRASFTLDRPGPWLLRATLIQPSKARPGEWDSVFTTLTLQVAARRRPLGLSRGSAEIAPDLLPHEVAQLVGARPLAVVRKDPARGGVHPRGKPVERGKALQLEDAHVRPVGSGRSRHERRRIGPQLLEHARLAGLFVDRLRHVADIGGVLGGLGRTRPPVVDEVDRRRVRSALLLSLRRDGDQSDQRERRRKSRGRARQGSLVAV